MKKEYLVSHQSDFDKEKLKPFSDRQERLEYISSENEILKQYIKDKLAALSGLDLEYEILNDTLALTPTILISCNKEMISALKEDKDLSIQENGRVYAI